MAGPAPKRNWKKRSKAQREWHNVLTKGYIDGQQNNKKKYNYRPGILTLIKTLLRRTLYQKAMFERSLVCVASYYL